MAADQPADLPVRQPLSGRIHRQHHPLPRLVGFFVGVGEYNLFPGHHLPPVVVFDRPRCEEQLPLLDRAIEKGLSGPRTFDQAG